MASRFARLWRGTLRYHFLVVASNFHSCAFRICYLPCGISDDVSAEDSVSLANQLVQVVGPTTVSLAIPFKREGEWVEVPQAPPGGEDSSNGVLNVYLVAPLVSGFEVVNPITIQVFVSAGPDFELALPSARGIIATGVPDFLQQSGELCYGGEEMRKIEYTSLGKSVVKVSSAKSQAVVLSSFKQIANMSSRYFSVNAGTALKFAPFGYSKVTLNPAQACNFWYNVRSMFRFYRGSVRIQVQANGDVVCNTTYGTLLNPLTQGVATDITDMQAPVPTCETIRLTNQKMGEAVDLAVPWYCPYRCLPSRYSFHGEFHINMNHITLTNKGTTSAIGFVGAGDDCMLGLPAPCPTLTVSYFYPNDADLFAKAKELVACEPNQWYSGRYLDDVIEHPMEESLEEWHNLGIGLKEKFGEYLVDFNLYTRAMVVDQSNHLGVDVRWPSVFGFLYVSMGQGRICGTPQAANKLLGSWQNRYSAYYGIGANSTTTAPVENGKLHFFIWVLGQTGSIVRASGIHTAIINTPPANTVFTMMPDYEAASKSLILDIFYCVATTEHPAADIADKLMAYYLAIGAEAEVPAA